jgi:hypothetical protein
MIIRRANHMDWASIGEFLNLVDYFMPVDPAQLGGEWLLAINNEGSICGTIWFFAGGQNAFIDYWAATSGRVASKLAATLEAVLRVLGVRYVRATISATNEGARRLATGLGMIESGNDYKLVFRSF